MTTEKSTKEKNTAAFLYGAHDLRLEERAIETPGQRELLVHIQSTGICGSDLHYYKEGCLGTRQLDCAKPMILGHESAGIVVAIGDSVSAFKVGDRVVIEPGRSCNVCALCRQGRYNLCATIKFSSSLIQGPNHGTLCRYVCFPETLCHILPENLSFDDGALIEPLAVAVHSVERTPIKAGSIVNIFGAGPVGLLTAAVALARGAVHCVIFDIDQSRLEFAMKYLSKSVKTILLPRKTFQDSADTLAWAQETSLKLGYDPNGQCDTFADIAYECTGAEGCIMLSIYTVQRGGTVMLIGLGRGRALIPTDIITTKEIDIKGNFRYANVHKEAIALVKQGRIVLSTLVSHRFRLEDSVDAFKLAETGGNGVIKIIITDE